MALKKKKSNFQTVFTCFTTQSSFNAVIDFVPRDLIVFSLRLGEGDLLSKTAFEMKMLDRPHYISRESWEVF